jgi:hypothetical protein
MASDINVARRFCFLFNFFLCFVGSTSEVCHLAEATESPPAEVDADEERD